MHPTPQEQLLALAGIVSEVGADEQVPAVARQRLSLAAAQLRRLAGNLAARPAFLAQDNAATAALLAELGDEALTTAADLDETDLHERNKALRAQLAELIHRLPEDHGGERARARIAAHLRDRTRADPLINRPRGATPS